MPITNKLTRIEGISNFIWINILYLLDAHVRMRSHQFNLSKLCTWTILSFAIRHSRFLDLLPRHVFAHKSLIYLQKYLRSCVLQGYTNTRLIGSKLYSESWINLVLAGCWSVINQCLHFLLNQKRWDSSLQCDEN